MRTMVSQALLLLLASALLAFGEQPKLKQNPPVSVDAWLSAHPNVARAIIWQDAHEKKAYPQWSPDTKKRLADAVADAIAGKPTGLPPVPPNAIPLKDTDITRQGLSPNDSYHLFVRYVANTLALELTHGLPWTIAHDKDLELELLLAGPRMFTLRQGETGGQYYEICQACGTSLPAPPDLALQFLRTHDLIGTSRLDTITRTVEWCKGMTHFMGSLSKPQTAYDTWQYRGFPPAVRVMEGKTMLPGNPAGHLEGRRHFTAGCNGTTGFLRSVLRAVNIPVSNSEAGRHSLPGFPTERKCLTHGDDPYNRFFITMYPPLSASELLIDQSRFESLFGPAVPPAEAAKHVSSRPRELAERYLPIYLLSSYIKDQASKKSHAEGQVYLNLKNAFSLEQLEAGKLWSRLDVRIAELGGAAKVAELEATLAQSSVAEENKIED